MKTQKEIEELHKELTIEIADKDTTPQRRKYLTPVVEVLAFILK